MKSKNKQTLSHLDGVALDINVTPNTGVDDYALESVVKRRLESNGITVYSKQSLKEEKFKPTLIVVLHRTVGSCDDSFPYYIKVGLNQEIEVGEALISTQTYMTNDEIGLIGYSRRYKLEAYILERIDIFIEDWKSTRK